MAAKDKKKEETADEVINRRIASEAAIGAGGGVAATFRAQQLADKKAADIERRSQSTSKPSANTPKGSTSLTAPKGSTSLTAPKANTSIVPRASNTSIVADPPMRNVTPRAAGGGVASVVPAAARLINPVTALLSTTGTLNQGAEFPREELSRMQSELEEAQTNRDNLQASEEALYEERMNKTRDRGSSNTSPESREAGGNQRSQIYRQMTPADAAPQMQYREAGGNQRSPMERQMATPADITAGAPKATIIPEQADLTEKAIALFRHTHGGPFNPKSSMDKKKMAAIQGLLSQAGSDKLTPNQFSLAIYRTTK
jgi:hypothetical protein